PRRQPADGHADGARVLLRHLLLPTRRSVLRATEVPQAAAAEVGRGVRFRFDDRLGSRSGGGGPRADDRLAAADVYQGHRPLLLPGRRAVEAGRLDPARHRAEGPARYAAADGALLRVDCERRQALDPARAD